MLSIDCSESPYNIGLQHGSAARVHVGRSIEFYQASFLKITKLNWTQVRELALEFEPIIREKWPAYLEEMKGLANGAGREISDIIALNVRTEISFGLFDDGCTALSWLTDSASFLGQNWDWNIPQKQNLVNLNIEQVGKPTIKMITEAGILGKIGLNSAGVGVCLNAIKAKGMDKTRLPTHLGLRVVLESSSRKEAIDRLEKYGVGASCHMLVADVTGSVGLEWSSVDCQELPMSSAGQVMHSNHYLLHHPGVVDINFIPDSQFRLERLRKLMDDLGKSPSIEAVQSIFKDEANYPGAICRGTSDGIASTLFNIVMDLKAPRAKVLVGLPKSPDETIELAF